MDDCPDMLNLSANHGRKFKSELEQVIAERDLLKASVAESERMDYAELQ